MSEREIKIQFLHEITEAATGDHPLYLLATKDSFGTIKEERPNGWYSVYWDGWTTAPFLAEIDVDFKIIE